MLLTRPQRFVAALVTLFCLLFTQLAVAAYACPGLSVEAAPMTISADQGAMPGCQDMDQVQSSLCQAHCEMGQQSADTPGTPHIPPFVAAELAVILPAPNSQPVAVAAHADAGLLSRSTAPPLAILNCCFRI